jgi:hypothetical protein
MLATTKDVVAAKYLGLTTTSSVLDAQEDESRGEPSEKVYMRP